MSLDTAPTLARLYVEHIEDLGRATTDLAIERESGSAWAVLQAQDRLGLLGTHEFVVLRDKLFSLAMRRRLELMARAIGPSSEGFMRTLLDGVPA